MANFEIRTDRFPVGTTVRVYPRAARIFGQAPSGASLVSDVVDASSDLLFEGLEPDAQYVAYALVSGEHRYVTFRTAEAGLLYPPPTAGQQILVSNDALDWELTEAAEVVTGSLNPDTEEGSAGSDNTFAPGDHSHPRSQLYDGHGIDDLHTVAASGAGAVVVLDPDETQSSYIRLTGNPHITMPSPVAGGRLTIAFQQDGVGGRVPVFGAHVGWVDGAVPSWSTDPALVDVVEFRCFDGVSWLAVNVKLGLQIPPPGMSVVQTGSMNSSGQFTQFTLPAPITPGNALLMIMHKQAAGEYTAPTGGGCDNWTQVGHAGTPDNTFQMWLGTSSAGGAGSEVIHYPQALSMQVIEIAGINANPAVAIDHVVPVDRTTASVHEKWPLPSFAAPRSGDMAIIGLRGSGAYFSDDSVGDALIPPLQPGVAGTFAYNGWTVVWPKNYQNNLSTMMFAYRLNTVNGEELGDDFKVYQGGGAGNAWGALMVFLRA